MMARLGRKLSSILVFVLFFGVAEISFAGGKSEKQKSAQKQQLVLSIKDAMKRSDRDHRQMKDRMEDEAERMVDNWKSSQPETINIKHTGTSSLEALDLGDPDRAEVESGEDTSGLNNLRTSFEEESIEINFDEELREVSSIKD